MMKKTVAKRFRGRERDTSVYLVLVSRERQKDRESGEIRLQRAVSLQHTRCPSRFLKHDH